MDKVLDHLDVGSVRDGDTIIGTLPVHLVAKICARGARYFHLSMELPIKYRGRELTAKEMQCFNARLEEYRVVRITDRASQQHIKEYVSFRRGNNHDRK